MTLQLAAAFRRRGHDHEIFSFGEVDRAFVASVGADGVPIYEAGGSDRGVRASLFGVSKLARLVRYQRPDLLQGHAWRSSIAAGLVGALSRTGAIATLHRVYYPRLEAVVDRLAQRLWRAVAVDSEAVKELLQRRTGLHEERVTAIPNFVGEEYFSVEPRPGGETEVRILIAAHFTEVKGHRFALHALARLAGEQPGRFRLDLLGEGPLLEPCKQLAGDLKIADAVHFHGRSHELRSWLAQADIVVLPSLWEGFGMILAEAMASARPAISFAIGGATEVIVDGETGFLVPPGDVNALTGAMRRLADEPALRQKFGMRGRQVARERFSVDAAVASYGRLYARASQSP